MFGLFKKKGGEAPEEQERPQKAADQEIRAGIHAMGQEFLPEELSVLAVTGPNPFGGGPREDGLWVASMGLTAWMEEDSPDIHREDIQLVTPADPRLLGFLRQRALPDFLIKFRARRSADGSQLLLLDLPQPGFDPDLKAILEEQKKPDSTYVEGLGTFVLNRQVGWYQADVDWLGQSIQLVYDRGREEEMKSAQQTALALLGAREDWDGKLTLRVRAAALGADRRGFFAVAAQFLKFRATGGADIIIHGHGKNLDSRLSGRRGAAVSRFTLSEGNVLVKKDKSAGAGGKARACCFSAPRPAEPRTALWGSVPAGARESDGAFPRPVPLRGGAGRERNIR